MAEKRNKRNKAGSGKSQEEAQSAISERRGKKAQASEDLKRIKIFIATQVADMAGHFMPMVGDAVQQTDKTVSWGVNVVSKMSGSGVIECVLKPRSPKIPMASLENRAFLLQLAEDTGQLEFVFDGTVADAKAASADGSVDAEGGSGGDYAPGDNAGIDPDDGTDGSITLQ